MPQAAELDISIFVPEDIDPLLNPGNQENMQAFVRSGLDIYVAPDTTPDRLSQELWQSGRIAREDNRGLVIGRSKSDTLSPALQVWSYLIGEDPGREAEHTVALFRTQVLAGEVQGTLQTKGVIVEHLPNPRIEPRKPNGKQFSYH